MKKTDYKHGKFTILSTEIDTDDFTREDFEAYCEDMGIEVGDEDDMDEAFYDWCAEETQANYEADMENIESCTEYNVPVVLTGTLGLWWGHPEIKPERFESVADAIRRCMNGSDCHDVLVEFNDGVITVDCYHHDGCNSFTIKALSKKGIAKQYAEYKEHDFKRLPYLYAIGI
jgi:hypothetical protein